MALEAHKIKYCLYLDNSVLTEITNILNFRQYSFHNMLENTFITTNKLNEVLDEIINDSLSAQIKIAKIYFFSMVHLH